MSDIASQPTMTSKCVAEAVGTFMLVFTVGCNVLSGNAVWGGVSIASVLMVAIYALGGISGANFNPAVSLALGLSQSMKGPGLPWQDVGIYMGVQICAGIAAAFSYYGLFLESFSLGPADGFKWWQAGLCEVLYTFMLCFVVLNVAAAKAVTPNQYYGLAIGFVITAGAYGAGVVSGGCFNPAVAIGIDVSSFSSGFGWCVMYALCEFVGAALAAVLFKVVRPEEFAAASGIQPTPGEGLGELVSEFLGTFILVLTVGLNVLGKSPAGAFSIAASLMCMIYALGDVSGAHFNPAVTLAIFASRRDAKLDGAKVGKYMCAQLCGGIAAAFTYSAIHAGGSFPLGPGTNFGWVEVAAAEIVFTFVLCYVVLCVAVAGSHPAMFGLAIGSCITVGGNAIGAVSGGSLNPAVSWGISVSHLMAGGGVVPALLYTVFEFVGAVLAAGVLMVTHTVDVDVSKDRDEALKQP